MKALGLHSGLKAAGGELVLVVFCLGEQLLETITEDLFSADNQESTAPFVFELAKWHAVSFQEFDELVAWNAPVLAAGDPVAAQPARIKPLAYRARGDLADPRHLACCKDCFHVIPSTRLATP